jgi:hypothetical protein
VTISNDVVGLVKSVCSSLSRPAERKPAASALENRSQVRPGFGLAVLYPAAIRLELAAHTLAAIAWMTSRRVGLPKPLRTVSPDTFWKYIGTVYVRA